MIRIIPLFVLAVLAVVVLGAIVLFVVGVVNEKTRKGTLIAGGVLAVLAVLTMLLPGYFWLRADYSRQEHQHAVRAMEAVCRAEARSLPDEARAYHLR